MAQGWCCTCRVGGACCGVSSLGSGFILGQSGNSGLSGLDVGCWRVGGLQLFQLFGGGFFVSGHGCWHVFQLFSGCISACFEDAANFEFFGVFEQLLFFGADFFKQVAIRDLRHRHAGVFHRQPNHRDHVSDDQDQVLRHLSPGHSAHTAQERAHQDTGQAHIHPHVEGQACQTGGDQAHAEDLRYHVNEGHQDGRKHANQTRHVAAVTCAQKVRDGELAKLAQVRCQEQSHQTVAACPAQNEGQTTVTCQVERAGHTDERSR